MPDFSRVFVIVAVLFGVLNAGSINTGSFSATWTRYGDVMQFTMTCQCTGWLAIGWSTTTAHSTPFTDMIVGSVSGTTVTLVDASSTSKIQPATDAQKNVVLVSGSESGSATTITFNRTLVTGDTAGDHDLIDGSLVLAWAFHSTSDTMSSQHTSRGSATVNFLKSCEGEKTLVNADALLYDNCMVLDSAFGVRVRWSLLSNKLRYQMQADIGKASGDSGYIATGIRGSNFQTFPSNDHPNMNGGTTDFVDVWAAGYSTTTSSCLNGCLYDCRLKGTSRTCVSTTDKQDDSLSNKSWVLEGTTLKSRFDKSLTVTDTAYDYPVTAGTTYYFYWSCKKTVTYSSSFSGSSFPKHQTDSTCRGQVSINFATASLCSDDYVTAPCNDTVISDPGDQSTTSSSGTGDSPVGTSFGDSSLTISYAIVGDTLEVTMTGTGLTGWLGLSISESATHVASDMYFVSVKNGVATVEDRYSDSRGPASKQGTQISTLVSGSEEAGATIVVFTRPLITSDPNHISITNKNFVAGWAYHPTSDNFDDQHSQRGQVNVNFITGGLSNVEEQMDPATAYSILIFGLGLLYALFYWSLKMRKVYKPINLQKDPEAGELKQLHGDNIVNARFAVHARPKNDPGAVRNFVAKLLSFRIPHYHFDVQDVLTFLVIIAINIVFIEKGPDYNYDLGLMTAQLTAPNMLIVVLLGTRSSVLSWILHFPFDHAISFHRWIGRLVLVLSIIHFSQYSDQYKDYMTGLIGLFSLFFLFVTSLGPIRRKLFSFFYWSHFSFFAFIIFCAFHAELFKKYAIAAAVVYGLDRLVRVVYGFIPRKTVGLSIEGDMVKVRFHPNYFAQYELGQYVFVNFPKISPFQFHPFTLSSGPDEPVKEICVKSLGDFTTNLKKLAQGGTSTLIRVDGPYGRWPFNVMRYRTVVLTCGGVGVTPCIAMLRHIYRYGVKDELYQPYMASVFFVWVVKNRSEYSAFEDVINHCKAKAGDGRFPALRLYIYLTGEKGAATSEVGFLSGRPNFEQVFLDIEQSFPADHKRAAVVTCGPKKMVDNVWDEAVKRTKGHTRFDFHHETFEF